MNSQYEATSIFTSEMIDEMIQIWTGAPISLLDVRFQQIQSNHPLCDYQMPSSMLLLTHGDIANVHLDHTVLRMDNFGVFHGGKGTALSIFPAEKQIEMFMIFYKADSVSLFKKNVHRMLESVNPFIQQFGYTPSNPIVMIDLSRQMLESWLQGGSLNQLHAKTLLYRLMLELYKDLEGANVSLLQPDPVMSTKRYLDEHYMNPVLFEDIAEMFAISRGQLTRLFKRRLGMSLQEYLSLKRLEAARTQLLHTRATVKEIAIGCGMVGELNLIRLFKKYYRMTPSEFRNKKIAGMHDYDIDNDSQYLYNEKRLTPIVKTQRDGEFNMFGQARSKEMVLAVAMSLMLLLTACTSGGAVNSAGTSGQAQETQSTTTVEQATSETRTVSTALGNVEVPLHPKKVVVDYIIGDAVALGVTPYGVAKAEEGGANPAFSEQIKDSIIVKSWDLAPEEIISLEPDLIILSFSQEPYEQLSKIAPTVYIPYGELTTEERIRAVGEALNKSEEAEAALTAYNTKLDKAKQKLKDAGLSDATVTIGQYSEKENFIAGSKHAAGVVVYKELGMKAPPKVQTEIIDANEYWGNISMEVLSEYSGDYMISLGDVGQAEQKNSVWKSIPAVQNNKIMSVDNSITWYTDITSSTALVDIIVNGLLDLSK